MSLGKKLFLGSSAGGACPTDSVQPFGGDSAYSSNVALYQLDSDGGTTNNVPDTVGNYNGTASNVTYSTGQFGNAANFSSTNYITVTGLTSTSTFSYSLWVKPTNASSSGFKGIFGKQNSEGQLFTDSGALKIWTTTTQTFTGSPTLSDNVWSHIVLSVSNGTGTIYINGIDKGTSTGISLPSTLYMGTASTQIGNSTYGYQGLIDQVRIYDKALSLNEVGILYNETTSTASDTNVLGEGSGVALYSLDYDASDASGNYDGTPTDVTFGVDGQINWGASFNGSSSGITTGLGNSQLSVSSAWSCSCWIYSSSFSNATNILGMEDSASPYSGWSLYQSTSAGLQPMVNGNAVGTAKTLTANQWYNVVLTYSGTVLKFYVDGTQIGSDVTISISTPSSNFDIGNLGIYNVYSGKIDQVRVFQKALSSSEVSTLYGETACVYTPTTDNNDYPVTNTAYYKLDNNAEDAKGNYDGTATNVNYKFGRYGQAAVFNGSSSKIEFTTDSNFVNDFTISAWINMSQLPASSYLYQVVAWGDEAAGERRSLGIWNGGSGDPKVYFSGYGGSANFGGSTSVSANQWHHVCVTRSGSTVKVYLNGSLDGTGTVTLNAYTGTTGRIGDSGSANENFNGSIDQVRIFDSALDSTAVANLYNEKSGANTSNFETALYKGTGAGGNYVSNVGFAPDLVWLKNRDASSSHKLFDSVRGDTQVIESNSTAISGVTSQMSGFEANGFILGGSASAYNGNNTDYVAWCWKGGGDAVLNEQGSIDSQVSANQDAGFSIVKYTATGTTATVGHGLSSKPQLIIAKTTNQSYNWLVYAEPITAEKHLILNLTSDEIDNTAFMNDTEPTSSVFTAGAGNNLNYANGDEIIAYCFHSVAGYQKVGSFTYSAGVSVNVGFAPQFVMFKKTSSAGGWTIVDNKRFSGSTDFGLFPHLPNQEVTNTDYLNLTSTGFTTTYSDTGTFIYLAIA